MKTRLELANEYALQMVKTLINKDVNFQLKDVVEESYEYADMILSGDNKEVCDKNLGIDIKVIHTDEWQPDWELIPNSEKWVAMDEDGGWRGYKTKPNICEKEKLWMTDDVEDYNNLNLMGVFNLYDGDWKDSLRKRPEGEMK